MYSLARIPSHGWRMLVKPVHCVLRTTRTDVPSRSLQSGQALVELALLLPFLLTFTIGIIEGGFLFRSYNGLVNATWYGARFALDGGSDSDVVAVIQSNASGIPIVASQADIYVVRGVTDASGTIATWTANHAFGSGAAQPHVSKTDLQQKLKTGTTGGADATLDSSIYGNVTFVLVEIDYQHKSATGSWVLPGTLPVRSYAVVQQVVPQ
jgi:Flp pilus assembly protein TadG